ncbi:MAG TPA: thioredoxin-dependent thiol peroxidase [Candidatus Rifleibacterium sp.]|nr:thioredoxin-dependent thiol peroxidase [Candidatus Rifleibacterium sp.]HPT46183.1 thioredoxin-dependent thiol peroxidase [Candidatus Rifleibacterium sp.]
MKAAELQSGDLAPEFELLDQDGKQHSLKEYAGRKVLLYFYPMASTPGCTKQACSLRDAFADLKALNVVVLGVSPDQPPALKKFAAKYSLNFVLLSDPDNKIAEAYRVLGEKTLFSLVVGRIIRSSFLIDESGKVLKTWYKVKPDETAPQALEFVKTLR